MGTTTARSAGASGSVVIGGEVVPDVSILVLAPVRGNFTPGRADQRAVKGSTGTHMARTRARRRSVGAVLVGSVLGLVLLGLASCTKDDPAAAKRPLAVVDARVDEPVNGTSAAVRMTIDNAGGSADRLLSATTDVADTATFHRSTTDAKGRSTMEGLQTVAVPAGEQVAFRPGGLHVMLEGLSRDLKVGDEVRITFRFEHAGTRVVRALVVPIGDGEMTGMDADGSHHHGGG